MREISLTQGKVTLVDDDDYEFLMQWSWYVEHGQYTDYAVSRTVLNNPTGKLRMHRVILGLTDSKIKGDHIDHNGLNNQRYNLRVATQSQNMANRRAMKNTTSRYLGVCYVVHKRKDKEYRYWQSAISTNNKIIRIGSFKTEEEAAMAYDDAAKRIHGEFANLNFLQSLTPSPENPGGEK